MRVDSQGPLHLTYCTNIHPADGWDAVFANVRKFAPALKESLAPCEHFGIGLRLSAREASELLEGARLAEFRAFLDRNGLYVALINGFPYGYFHGAPVKESVYAPDWRDPARVEYTLALGRILAELLPPGMDGGVSTAPISYKPWKADEEIAAKNVIRVAEAYAQIHRDTGKFIHLDIEPEPNCHLENTDETIGFFERWPIPRDYVRVCFDCCHFAVEYEDPLAALERFHQAGIRIGRVQLSSALRVPDPAHAAEHLRPFAESTYLHQTIEKQGDVLRRFPDLDQALEQHNRSLTVAAQYRQHVTEPQRTEPQLTEPRPSGSGCAEIPESIEWRIHFHVPLFTSRYDHFESTQDYVRTVIRAALSTTFTHHLEIETYTWDVLPPELKIDLLESIRREYQWVLAQCEKRP